MTAASQEAQARTPRTVRGPAPGAVAAAKAIIELAKDPRFKDYLEVTDEDRRVASYHLPSKK